MRPALDSIPRPRSKGTFPSSPTMSRDRQLVGKRAAVVLYSYYPADPRPRRAAEAMIGAGMSVDLICLRESDREPSREVVNGVNVLRLPIPKKRGGKIDYLLQYSGFAAACSAILAFRTLRRRYDIVHAHNMPDFLAFSGLVPRLFGSKIILDLHDPMPELIRSIYDVPPNHWLVRLLIRLERWSVAGVDLVATPNIAFRDLFVSRGCPAQKITIVMNSPQGELFNPKRFETGSLRSKKQVSFQLMYHGLLVPRHGLDTAIRAVAAVREHIPALQFHIYGDRTPYMDQMNDLIERLGLAGSVRYHGRKPHEEIAMALASIDLGIIPNRRNPFTELNMPTRIFETLAMGKPVVVPNTKGIRDYFDESQIIFFEPDNVESLAQAIKWAYLHPREVRKMVLRGQTVLNAHSWDRERENFVQSLRDLVGAPDGRISALAKANH
jgi:glycosyltransferase involved in cell wall biosynthesis